MLFDQVKIQSSFVINLESSVDRMEAFSLAFKDLDYVRIAACTPTYVKQHFAQSEVLIPQEIACTESHKKIWEKVKTYPDDAWALILEDDAVPLEDFDVNSIQLTVPDTHMMFLQDSRHVFKNKDNTVKSGQGTYAYIVDNVGASKLLKALTPQVARLDKQIFGYAIDATDYPFPVIVDIYGMPGTHYTPLKACVSEKPLFTTGNFKSTIQPLNREGRWR